jgi:hypothetical protein
MKISSDRDNFTDKPDTRVKTLNTGDVVTGHVGCGPRLVFGNPRDLERRALLALACPVQPL